MNKRNRRIDAHEEKYDTKANAGVTSQSLCSLSNRDAPVNQE
jgi:hypothetical protein